MYLKLTSEYELHILPNTKLSAAKDHGENYIKVRLSLVHRLLRNRLLDSPAKEHLLLYTCQHGVPKARKGKSA